ALALKNGLFFVSEGPRSCQEKSFTKSGITWPPRLHFRPKTSRFKAWNEENIVALALKNGLFFVSEGPRSCQEKSFTKSGITWPPRLHFRPKTSRFKAWNEENIVGQLARSNEAPKDNTKNKIN
nr:hypothetical protein [Tanacetum cinerariifolium]